MAREHQCKEPPSNDEIYVEVKREHAAATAETARRAWRLNLKLKKCLQSFQHHRSASVTFEAALQDTFENVLANLLKKPKEAPVHVQLTRVQKELIHMGLTSVEAARVLVRLRAHAHQWLQRLESQLREQAAADDETYLPPRTPESPCAPYGKHAAEAGSNRLQVPATETKSKEVRLDERSTIAHFMKLRKRSKIKRWVKNLFSGPQDMFEYLRKQIEDGEDDGTMDTGLRGQAISWASVSALEHGRWCELYNRLVKGEQAALLAAQALLLECVRERDACPMSSDRMVTSPEKQRSPDDTFRSVHAVGLESQKGAPPQPKATRNRWTIAEDEKLAELVRLGWKDKDIATALPSPAKRTPSAISARKTKLKHRASLAESSQQAVIGTPKSALKTPQRAQALKCQSQARSPAEGRSPTSIAVSRAKSCPPLAICHSRVACPIAEATRSTNTCRPKPLPSASPSSSQEHQRESANLVPTLVHLDRQALKMTCPWDLLWLPIGTPDVPISNAGSREVTKACSAAFGLDSGFCSAHQHGERLWVAAFKPSGAFPLPKLALANKVIEIRGVTFKPRLLPQKTAQLFAAAIAHEPGLRKSRLMAGIANAFRSAESRPTVGLLTRQLPGKALEGKVVARFSHDPCLLQFYIPVLVEPSKRRFDVRFEAVSAEAHCWRCQVVHDGDGWCPATTTLQYPPS